MQFSIRKLAGCIHRKRFTLSFLPMNLPSRGRRLLRSCHDNKNSVLLVTTVLVLILSPTELQQVTDLKREKEALEKKLAHYIKEKAALEGEVEKLRQENADLIADVETLKEWSEDFHKLVKITNRDFENLFDDIINKNNLFEPGTDHTDNCDVFQITVFQSL